ncbi:DUF4833 domain-containing protein [Aurantibacillus circumpalustris]|uniref:DUF4833 domain-containing protein n=1 Tax=Aurantibacillus circumpalustris TaxID=3036359 RepID=UPI00295A92B1|nr:DUF4833 domain-containing protein [Aurantibacillus circumpalustris]
MKKTITYLILLITVVAGTSFVPSYNEPKTETSNKNPIDTFPVPVGFKKMIFYVQRTLNTNTIIYELNYDADSTLNKTEPVNCHWIRYDEKGEVTELSYFQKKYAYGLNAVLIDATKLIYKLNFVSYKKRDIFLSKAATGHSYKAYMVINGKLSYIEKIFVQIDGGTFWLPHISFVEIKGYDIATGKPVLERIIP